MRQALLVLMLAVPILAGTPRPSHGLQGAADRHSVEAAMIAHFAALVSWPSDAFASASSPFVVCVFLDDPFGRYLDQATEGKKVGSRSIAIEQRRRGDSAVGCQIAFINGASSPEIADLVDQSVRLHVLTVTDDRRPFEQGLLVQFFVGGDGKVGFEIDRLGAKAAGLRINDFLLTLSTSMVKKREQSR